MLNTNSLDRKTMLICMGFILLIVGFLSLTLMIVGVQFTFLKWLDMYGRGLGFLCRIVMVMAGFVMIFFGVSIKNGIN